MCGSVREQLRLLRMIRFVPFSFSECSFRAATPGSETLDAAVGHNVDVCFNKMLTSCQAARTSKHAIMQHRSNGVVGHSTHDLGKRRP